jgi:hypothetical protein
MLCAAACGGAREEVVAVEELQLRCPTSTEARGMFDVEDGKHPTGP